MITPAFDSIEETYDFMEALQDIVSLELEGEYLWPSSNPPMLPEGRPGRRSSTSCSCKCRRRRDPHDRTACSREE